MFHVIGPISYLIFVRLLTSNRYCNAKAEKSMCTNFSRAASPGFGWTEVSSGKFVETICSANWWEPIQTLFNAMSTSSAASAIRSSLRRLVRAKNLAFKGDETMLLAAGKTIREEFQKNANKAGNYDEAWVKEILNEMDSATKFLQDNVVQAPLNQRGNYEVDAKRIDEKPK